MKTNTGARVRWVLAASRQGIRTEDIAKQLGLTAATVKHHLQRMERATVRGDGVVLHCLPAYEAEVRERLRGKAVASGKPARRWPSVSTWEPAKPRVASVWDLATMRGE